MVDTTITRDRIDEMVRVLFKELKARGGQANGTDLIAAIKPKLNLQPYELDVTETGKVRWETHLRFYTTDCVKAGFLTKSDGRWTLTAQGEQALNLPPGQLIRTASRAYRLSRKAKAANATADVVTPEPAPDKIERQAVYEEAKEQARKEIDQRLDEMGAYDFQQLVAELLKAMGYFVPYVAPPGPDGGVDVVAYKDPLGTTTPRIRVQVKHRDTKVTAKDVREMQGLLHKDGDVGLIVSSGGFTSDAQGELRSTSRHIEIMDQDRLVDLWQQHYEKLSEAGKNLLPLVRVYFLAPDEQ